MSGGDSRGVRPAEGQPETDRYRTLIDVAEREPVRRLKRRLAELESAEQR